MQVNVKTEQKKFQPVNLNITFETEQELHSFIHLMGLTATVPSCVAGHVGIGGTSDDYAPNFDQLVLGETMGQVYDQLLTLVRK